MEVPSPLGVTLPANYTNVDVPNEVTVHGNTSREYATQYLLKHLLENGSEK
jgi:hypothetical protein